MHAAHIKDTSGAPSSDGPGYCASGPTGHLLHKATLSRPGEVSELPNTQKQTYRVGQNEEIEKYVPNKGQEKNTGKELNEYIQIGNLPDNSKKWS